MSTIEIIAGCGLAAVPALGSLMTLIQIAPIKVNPWSALGRMINHDLLNRVNAIEAKLDGHIDKDDKRMADMYRSKILSFNNEILRDIGHTKEEFIEVLTDIDVYEKYCADHTDYKNNRVVHAIGNIQRVYDERLEKHDFLQ